MPDVSPTQPSAVAPTGVEPTAVEATGVERLLGILSAIPVALIVVLTFADVFGRYVFSSPIRGSVEIIEVLMALVIFTALPLVTRQRQHVSVGLRDNLLRGGLRRVQQVVCDLISVAALALITWRLAAQAHDSLKSNEASVVLSIPQAPLGFAMAVLAALATLAAQMLVVKGSPSTGAHA